MEIAQFPVSSSSLAELVVRIKSGELPSARAREAFQRMVETGEDVSAAMRELNIEGVDESELIALCERLVAANPRIVADVQSGKQQALGALVGQAKKSNPNVDPSRVREICLSIINNPNA
jgi:aspartyl-tRNA(Asn)/glutamyl-tRNA(Gln) amidotransferase subunit B